MSHHLNLSLRRASICVAALGLLPALAAPAVGAERTVEDTVGDMWKIEEGSTDPNPAPRARRGDFVRTTFKHTDKRVTVRAKFVELERAGKMFRLWVKMRDEHRRKTFLGIEAVRSDRGGKAWLMSNRGADIACNVRHRIDYRNNVVRASFRRTCLDTPRYLEFKAYSEQVLRSWTYAYLDNPFNKRAATRLWTGRVRAG